ncbi:mitochondrial dicarboxylate carrier [Annulohypoxylon maeteangense]|uniref:mitochondrial dicarboxylate carrier n=1 Tax=Annulohypoxylon maeteangense TaxID=1927788 RepID=UPI00200866E3|nr:mitochondrial dicarboxylate carrier [Annulohypoxylon maeteangense]KAI0885317.1 mitochondrial dicarboxylate carrier [Annulohypoxylon maeteangense]
MESVTTPRTSNESPVVAATNSAAAKPKNLEKKKAALAHERISYPFWFGGSASSFAACVTHPLDLVKVRLQLRSGDAPKNMSGTFMHIVRSQGPLGLYNGLTASLLRQMTYSTVRFGVYEELKRRSTPEGTKPSLPLLIGLSTFSGFLGGISGNAADVTNVRMQQDLALPPAQRRGYKHGLDGMFRMLREEGVKSWFRGVLPNSTRAALMNASQLASYDTFKSFLITYTPLGDTTTTHFASSLIAGFVATTVCSPVDVIKSRVMSTSHEQGIAHLLREIYAKEGVTWMFKGWVPAFLRLGPQTICTFLFLEAHRKGYRKFKGLED